MLLSPDLDQASTCCSKLQAIGLIWTGCQQGQNPKGQRPYHDEHAVLPAHRICCRLRSFCSLFVETPTLPSPSHFLAVAGSARVAAS